MEQRQKDTYSLGVLFYKKWDLLYELHIVLFQEDHFYRIVVHLAEERIHKVLENVLNDNELYQTAQKEVDEAINELEKAGLSREQNKVVDKAISASNASGAAYGATAYKQGLYDGIKLMLEVKQIGQGSGILNEQELDCKK